MTFHENLQTYPKLLQIHLGKDKRIQILPLLKNLIGKAVNFGFLNSTTFILGIFSLDLYISGKI
jgi:hypothetical protein